MKEGVSVLRTRFGFTRTTGTSSKVGTGNYLRNLLLRRWGTSFFTGPVSQVSQASPRTERRQKLFLSKLEYFNSSGAPDRNIKERSRQSNNCRVAVNNSINRAKQSHYNAKQDHSVTKSVNKSSPGLLSPSHRKTDDQHQGGSGLKKPLFVTKYSPYRGDNAKQSAPLIMTAGREKIPLTLLTL